MLRSHRKLISSFQRLQPVMCDMCLEIGLKLPEAARHSGFWSLGCWTYGL